jgi:transcriptional regulator with XRE-family HTH domain
LRKDLLKLTQEELSIKINISRSNYANIEKANINLTERVVNDICRVFSISKDWLLNGEGDVFIDQHNALVDRLVDIYKMLNDDNRKYLEGYIYRLLEEQNAAKE